MTADLIPRDGHQRRFARRWRLLLPLAVTVLVAAACGGDAEPTEATEPPPDTTADATSPDTTADEPPPDTSDAEPSPDTTAAKPEVVVDEEFLTEQASRSLGSEEPGAVMVAVFDRNGSVVHASLGTDPAGVAPALDDAFRIGSITKVLTAITVLTLVDEGQVDLDAPVSDYLTRIAVDGDVSVRDVLRHEAGIEDPLGFLTAISDDRSRVWTPEEVLATTTLDDLVPSPHDYANVNYSILGVLIEEVTGGSYHQAVRRRVLEPVGMTSTYLAHHESGAEIFAGYANVFGDSGFSGRPEPIDFDLTSTETHAWASGAMVSTAGDLHELMTALFGAELIAPALVDEMTPDTGYGLGLYVPEFSAASPIFGHDGRIPGSGTWLVHAPDTGATVFTVVNGDHLFVSPATEAVVQAIAAPSFSLDR